MEILRELKAAKAEVSRLDAELKAAKALYDSLNAEAVQQFLDGGLQGVNWDGHLFSLVEESWYSFNPAVPDETRKDFLREHQLDFLIKETINPTALKSQLRVLAEAIGKDEILSHTIENESEIVPILNVFEKAEIRIKKAVPKKSKI